MSFPSVSLDASPFRLGSSHHTIGVRKSPGQGQQKILSETMRLDHPPLLPNFQFQYRRIILVSLSSSLTDRHLFFFLLSSATETHLPRHQFILRPRKSSSSPCACLFFFFFFFFSFSFPFLSFSPRSSRRASKFLPRLLPVNR